VNRLKFISNIGPPALPQFALAEFLATGGYDRHIRGLRMKLAGQMAAVRRATARYFPEGTRITQPAGGHMLWVELPHGTDSVAVFRQALERRISILPGTIFAAGHRYQNCLRLNCGQIWSEVYERALMTVGTLCRQQTANG